MWPGHAGDYKILTTILFPETNKNKAFNYNTKYIFIQYNTKSNTIQISSIHNTTNITSPKLHKILPNISTVINNLFLLYQ